MIVFLYQTGYRHTFLSGIKYNDLLMLRSDILRSSENTKTNGVNMRGFFTDTFFNWLKVGLSKYL